MPWPPKKNTIHTFAVGLVSQANAALLQAAPTLAAGDVKVSIDGGAFANLTNLPTVTPAAGKRVEVVLTAAEMNGDVITVLFSDAAGAEWNDLQAVISTVSQTIDDLDTGVEIAAAILAAIYEGSETVQDGLRLFRAALVGKLSGAGTLTVSIRDAADTKDRIVATVDQPGNRTAITTDAT